MADEDFKVIKVERFDTKGIRHAFDDVGRQTFNNRVSLSWASFSLKLTNVEIKEVL